MDDSCAVCADTLEWVAYGPCGHRDVCSTCVVRLRFICDDRRCCICKTDCHVVFVTKANGLLTRVINDFSVLPSDAREGRLGSYWYHEDTQAFFDDSDHYKMVKAMCKLSCSVCDKSEEQPIDGSKRRQRFRNIEQLKGHLFHQHRMLMCSLCLEGRKVFICEQKLYTRAQLNQHVNSGNSEVDGTESERGGFMGHPMCEFCRTPFYGENELYSHMTTEHYTCHMCQRQHPGQYVYYKNYDDLEIHFGREHFLCEDEACLAKKFVVFQSETEMKRHNALEHGGRMSRSQRNAVLQVPTSFRYQSYEQDNRRGRRRTFRRDSSDNLLSMAIQASLEAATPADTSSTNTPAVSDHDIDPIVQPFESLVESSFPLLSSTSSDSEPPSRYLQALSHASRNASLVESSFPPLSSGPSSSSSSQQQKPKPDPPEVGLSKNNTMAALLRRKNNIKTVTVVNSSQAWPSPSRAPSANPIPTSRPVANIAPGSSSFTSGQSKVDDGPTSYAHPRPSPVHAPSSSSSRMIHSSSAPNLAESFDSSSDFPPVSATQVVRKVPTGSNQKIVKVDDDVKTANKSLVEKMRAALQFDEDKYSAFKVISGEYRQGLMDTWTYLTYVEQFGLSHLVLELARLCPDVKKQKELVDIYNASLRDSGSQENGQASKRGKGKAVDTETTSLKDNLADRVLTTVRNLQSTYNKPPSEEEVEVLSKDGYRGAKGKSKVMVDETQAELLNSLGQLSVGGRPDSSSEDGGGGGRSKQQRKKTSKFLRARLGDGSVASLLDRQNSEPDPDSSAAGVDNDRKKTEGLPTHGVWRKGGGQRLFL